MGPNEYQRSQTSLHLAVGAGCSTRDFMVVLRYGYDHIVVPVFQMEVPKNRHCRDS